MFFTFDMGILHKRGKDNIVTNALSWKYDEFKDYAISIVVLDLLNEIWGEYAKDPYTCTLINDPN